MRVGTSNPLLRAPQDAWDHPHACGDKTHPEMRAEVARGSSPCVWGQDCDILTKDGATGIIPMRVGTRYNFNPILIDAEDHPHACGDKYKY